MQLPAPLREGIEEELAGFDGTRLRAAAASLSKRYQNMEAGGGPHLPAVGKCGVGGKHISDDLDRAAYLAVRMPATFAAISAALRWTQEALSEKGPAEIRSMLDLGSGPGTALWAAAQVFPTLASATAVERDPRLIEIGRRLASRCEDTAVGQTEWVCGDLTGEFPLPQQTNYGLAGEPADSWDLVVCAYALNEIAEGQRAHLIRQAWARCSGVMVIIEPGTRAGFANVLAVRSQMLASENLGGPHSPTVGECGVAENSSPRSTVDSSAPLVAPCPHSLACPMAASGDWCHFAARVERTSLHRRLKEAELGHEDEKFSYVAFMRGTQRQEAQCPRARIVRHPRIFSGYAQLTLCAEGRLEQATITHSQKEDWRRLKRLGWGDEW